MANVTRPRQWPTTGADYTPGNVHGVTTQGVGYGASTAGNSTAGNRTSVTPGVTPSTGIGGRASTAGFSGSTPAPTQYSEGVPTPTPYNPGRNALPTEAGFWGQQVSTPAAAVAGQVLDGNQANPWGAIGAQIGAAAAAVAEQTAAGAQQRRGRGRAIPEMPEDLLPNMQDALARAQAAGMDPYTDPYLQQIDAMRGQLYGDYDSRYIPKIDALTDRLLNRDPFRYNWSDDPLYRQYAARYQQAARQGMQDAMGQTAALTGGYGSSYAQAAGQQAYANQMAGLNDAALQLYQMAAQRYDQEGQDMRSNLAALEQREAANRQNYDTDRATWYNRQDTDLQNLLNQQAMAYQLYQDQLAREMQERQLAWDQYQYWNSLYENKYHV